MTDIDQI